MSQDIFENANRNGIKYLTGLATQGRSLTRAERTYAIELQTRGQPEELKSHGLPKTKKLAEDLKISCQILGFALSNQLLLSQAGCPPLSHVSLR